jgi:hypothetical protein
LKPAKLSVFVGVNDGFAGLVPQSVKELKLTVCAMVVANEADILAISAVLAARASL